MRNKSNSYYLLFCLVALLTGTGGRCQEAKTEWLQALRTAIDQSPVYDAQKKARLDSLYPMIGGREGTALYDHQLKLFEEYAVFNFDSAYIYARRLKETATGMKDSARINYAQLKMSAVLLSSGMFKELFDSLPLITATGLPAEAKGEFYMHRARCFFDLADYNQDRFFSQSYNEQADRYIDSCIANSPRGSFISNYYTGLKYIRMGDIWKANAHFAALSRQKGLTLREQAITHSTYSDIYIRRGMPDSAAILLAQAAIEDIRNSTKETTAILHLASLLYRQGDLENASLFIRKAANDAGTFGARQRMVQLSNVLPLIEGGRVAAIEKEKSNLALYAMVITLFLVFLVILIFIIIRQVRKLNAQQKEINRKNLALHHLLQEKEWLLKEVHHRVKNNLHTITSLLESQASYLKDDALTAIRSTQHRVYAMALIHQKLYQPEKIERGIELSPFLQELVRNLKESYETGNRVRFKMNLDPLELDISQAVPLGLILNEAITNALKYAFPGQQEGEISISLQRTAEYPLLLEIADNGVGLPAGLDIRRNNSLGMKLMKGLSEDLAAKFIIENKEGTRIFVYQTLPT